MSDVPRIDNLRRSLDGTVRLLGITAKGVATLHELAYDRRVADEVRVRGGQPDYALDTNGDPAARAAYKTLALAVDTVCVQLVKAAQDSLKVLNEGSSAGRNRQHPAYVTVAEHAEAIAAQARRVERGEFDAGRTLPQPGSARVVGHLRRQVDQLQSRNAQLTRTIKEESERITSVLGDSRMDQGRRRRQISRAAGRLSRAIDADKKGRAS